MELIVTLLSHRSSIDVSLYDKTIREDMDLVKRADKNVPLETARYGRGYEINTEFNLQWNCSRWEL